MFLSLSPFKTYNALGACEEARGVEVELKNVLQQLLGCWMFGPIVGIGPQEAKGYQPLQSKKTWIRKATLASGAQKKASCCEIIRGTSCGCVQMELLSCSYGGEVGAKAKKYN